MTKKQKIISFFKPSIGKIVILVLFSPFIILWTMSIRTSYLDFGSLVFRAKIINTFIFFENNIVIFFILQLVVVYLFVCILIHIFKSIKNLSLFKKIEHKKISELKSNITSPVVRLLAFILDIVAPFVIALPFALIQGVNEQIGILFGGIVFIAVIVLNFLLMYRRSQTIGKFLFNIQVQRASTKKRCSFLRFWLLREIVGKTLIVGVLPLIGFIFQPIYSLIDLPFIFSKQRQTIHDRIADTIVINLPDEQKRKGYFDFSELSKN